MLALAVLTTHAARADSGTRVVAGTSVSPLFDDGPHVGPDARTLRYEHAGRWLAAAGGEVVVVGVQGPTGALALTVGGLLELANEDDAAPVPFQLLRAAVVSEVRAATNRIRLGRGHRGRASMEIGFAHESDHVTGNSDTADRLRPWVDLDNFSSFEALRLGGHYELWLAPRLWAAAGAGLRLFTPPLNRGGGREQVVGLDLELRGRARLTDGLGAYLALYGEGIWHRLAPRRVGLDELPTVLTTVRAEAGLTVATSRVGRFDLYAGLTERDGRGLDFIRHYGLTALAGLRASF